MNEKNLMAKTPLGNFQVITPEISLFSQAVISKGIPVPYINLQLNPYPNTQLDLFYSDNLSFQCTASSTNKPIDARIPIRGLHTNLRKMLVAKFFSSLTR